VVQATLEHPAGVVEHAPLVHDEVVQLAPTSELQPDTSQLQPAPLQWQEVVQEDEPPPPLSLEHPPAKSAMAADERTIDPRMSANSFCMPTACPSSGFER
jgi:hypothetical protein